jgi:hypothetical protein
VIKRDQRHRIRDMSMAKKKVENLRARAPNRPGIPFPEFFAILESSGEDSRFHRDYWKTLQLLLIISSVFGVRIKLQKFFVISSCFSKTGIAVEHAISFQIALLILPAFGCGAESDEGLGAMQIHHGCLRIHADCHTQPEDRVFMLPASLRCTR